jgi:hypothetical protein
MKQIKTIRYRLNNSEHFDEAVNAALAAGWELKKREVINPQAMSERCSVYIMLYAELERETEPEKVERKCSTCKHVSNPPFATPCNTCTHDNNKWESKEV